MEKRIYDELVFGILRALPSQVIRIVLYGSVARGTNTEESDVDIAVFTARKVRMCRYGIRKADARGAGYV